MNEDKVIEVRSEDERRHLQRRAEDRMRDVRSMEQVADMLARERRWNLLQAAAVIYAAPWSAPDYAESVHDAEELLDIIEKREIERREHK